jgi:hypothetical protein
MEFVVLGATPLLAELMFARARFIVRFLEAVDSLLICIIENVHVFK